MAGKNFAMLTLAGDATKLEKALNRGISGIGDMVDEVEDAGRKMKASAEKFDAVGDSAGTLDSRAMGFRDTITGVQDSMAGWSALMEGDVAGGLLTMGAGIGDLASGVENLGAPMAKMVAQWVTGNATMSMATITSVGSQVAAWATLGVQSLLHAAKVAAAWLISMGPLILVGAAVIALVVLIVKNWDTIKEVISKGWEFVKKVSLAAWDAIKAGVMRIVGALVAYFQLQIRIAKGIFRVGWAVIKTVSTVAWSFIQKFIIDRMRLAITTAKRFIDQGIGFFRQIPGRVRSALGTLASAITAPFRKGFGAIRDIWNSTVGGKGFSVPSWVPGVGGKSFRIPKLHQGGIFNALGGRREGLALLRDGETVRTPEQEALLARARQRPESSILEMRSDGSVLGDALLELMRRAIRVRGGNVELVLGGQAA